MPQIANIPDQFMSGQPYTHYTLYLPMTVHGGELAPPSMFQWAEQEITQEAGGLTRYHPGAGLWISPTTRVRTQDFILPYHIVAPRDPATHARLIALKAEIARVFEQEEIFLFTQPVWLL